MPWRSCKCRIWTPCGAGACSKSANGPLKQRMGAAGVARFVQHYERITRRMLATLPTQADAVLRLDDAHRVAGLRLRR